MTNVDLPERIEWIVRNRGYDSLRALARATKEVDGVGVSHNYLSRLVTGQSGKKGALGQDEAQALAKAARVDLHWLQTGEGKPEGQAKPQAQDAAEPTGRPRPTRELIDQLHREGHKNNRAAQAVMLLRDWLLPAAAEAVLLEEPHDDWSIDEWLELARDINARAKRLQAEIQERPSQKQPIAPRLRS